MEADLSRLPTGNAAWLALIEHALTLGDLSEVSHLELKSGLPFTDRTARKHSGATLARAILGMSNRSPETAARYFGGHGIILVGIKDSAVDAAQEVDPADLGPLIQPFLGTDGPVWDHLYIRHLDGLVMAIVVDPPAPGDPMFVCRQAYTSNTSNLALRDGDVFVRRPGQTVPANSAEIMALVRRTQPAADAGVDLAVHVDGGFDRIVPENLDSLMADRVKRHARDLEATAPTDPGETTASPYGVSFKLPALGALARDDSRGLQGFLKEVDAWERKTLLVVPQIVNEFMRHYRLMSRLRVTNNSSRFLEGVTVRVGLPGRFTALIEGDSDYCDHGANFQPEQFFPPKPARWADPIHSISRLIGGAPLAPPTLDLPSFSMQVEQAQDRTHITWRVGDLPGRETIVSPERLAIFTEDQAVFDALDSDQDHLHESEIAAQWSVTARGIHHVFEGDVAITCRQGGESPLAWTPAPKTAATHHTGTPSS